MSKSLDPDQARRIVGPDQGPNCLPRLSADDTGRQRVKQAIRMLMQSMDMQDYNSLETEISIANLSAI